MKRSTLLILLKYLVGLGILAYVVHANWDKTQNGEQVGLSVVLERSIDFRFFALGLGLYAVGVGLTFLRWYYLAVAQDLPITPRDVVRLGLLGFFFNTFLPGSVGGDLVKAAFLIKEQSRRTHAIASVMFDRVIGLTGSMCVATFIGGSLLWGGVLDPLLGDPATRVTLESILTVASLATLGAVTFWIAIGFISKSLLDRLEALLERIPKIGHALADLVRAVRDYRQKGRFVILALGLAILGHVCFVLTFVSAAHIFSDDFQLPPLAAHFLIVPIGMSFKALVPLPGGVGGAEVVFGKLYELMGSPFAAGVLASIGQLAFQIILGALGMVAYRMVEGRTPRPENESGQK